MRKLLNGRIVSAEMSELLKNKTIEIKEKGVIPILAIVRIGDRPDDISYEKGILRSAAKIGAVVESIVLPMNVSLETFKTKIEFLNNNDKIHGILIFRPLPKQLPEIEIKGMLDPKKDLDCFTSVNMAKIFESDKSGFCPCTPSAVLEILDYYKIDVAGKHIGIIGRSLVVGKPLAMMLLDRNATITICHSKTPELSSITSKCDIVIAAVGRGKMVKKNFVKEGAIVIDVGINVDENGKLCGDVDFEDVADKADSITPVPGGVGVVTNNVLLKQLIEAATKTLTK